MSEVAHVYIIIILSEIYSAVCQAWVMPGVPIAARLLWQVGALFWLLFKPWNILREFLLRQTKLYRATFQFHGVHMEC